MGCPISTNSIAPSAKSAFGSTAARIRIGQKSSPPKPFIHKMLRPQLDPSVPPIGFPGQRMAPQRRRSGLAEGWAKRRYSLRRNRGDKDDDTYLETSSVESCLARVITLRDEIEKAANPQPRLDEGPRQANGGSNTAGASIPTEPSISSATSEIAGAQPQNVQFICGTAVTFEWLFQRLVEKFKCREEPEPQWIVEKMNDIGEWDLDRTTVLRVTFGWENPRLPKSVVLKICERHEEDAPEAGMALKGAYPGFQEAKLASSLFRRECVAYEWLSKQRKVAIPRVFVIKKQWSKSANALLVMEDLSERAQIGDLNDGIPLDGVRDLLRVLAQLHALSMVQGKEWRQTLDGAQLPTFLFGQIEGFFRILMAPQHGYSDHLDVDRLRQLEHLLSGAHLERMVTQSCEQLQLPECLLHGHPSARNVFFKTNTGGGMVVQALIDWTQAHSGCFGEDLAKCICWNLNTAERRDGAQLVKLLQYYHYQLMKKLQSYGADAEMQRSIRLEKVQAAYERFVPLAAVTFLLFLPEDLNRADGTQLERALQLVDEAAETAEWEQAEEPKIE